MWVRIKVAINIIIYIFRGFIRKKIIPRINS